jgi:DNA-binding transcriptional MerR regulator
MPYRETETVKLYYTMGEVSKMFNVNPSLIRFWEKEFEIIQPKKNKKGNRLFTQDDLDNFRTIYSLVKEKGFTLQGAKASLSKIVTPAKETNKEILLGKLLKIKKELSNLRDTI